MSSQDQMTEDEALARRLQEEEMRGAGIPPMFGAQFRRMLESGNQTPPSENGGSNGSGRRGNGGRRGSDGNARRQGRSGRGRNGSDDEERRFREDRQHEFARLGMNDPFETMMSAFRDDTTDGNVNMMPPFPLGMGANPLFNSIRTGMNARGRGGNAARGSRRNSDRGRDGGAGGDRPGRGIPGSIFGGDIFQIFSNMMGGGGGGGGGRNGEASFTFDFNGMLPNPFGEISYEQWMDYIERTGGNVHRGATPEQISGLPTHVLDKEMNGESDDKTCPICLGEFEKGNEIRTLPCTHFFHKDCIDPWLNTNTSCPRCRADIRGDDNGASRPNNIPGRGGSSGRRTGSRRSSTRAGGSSSPRAGARRRSRDAFSSRAPRGDNGRS